MRRIPRGPAAAAAGPALLALAVVVAAVSPTPAQTDPASGAPDALARYVPAENLVFLLEFSGLENHAETWRASAAYQILNTTSTGELLSDLVAQAVDMGTADQPDRRIGGGDALALLEHVARHGAVVGFNGPIEGFAGEGHSVIVLRNAAIKEARPVFGKLLGSLMGAAAQQARPQERGGRRIVEYTPEGSESPRAWWVEDGHLFLTEAKDLDVILGVLDGTILSAVDHPVRAELAARDGAFEPVGWLFLDLAHLPADTIPPAQREQMERLGLTGLQRLDYRWGFEGPATMGQARLVAPEPRTGLLGLIDQPTFGVDDLPPIPAGVEDFTVVGFDPLAAYDQITTLLTGLNPQAQAKIEEFEALVQERVHRKLREEILGTIGPKAALYFAPDDGGAGRGLNPLAAVASLSVQVPKTTLVVELKDPAGFSRSLDELIIQANRAMEQQTAALLGGADEDEDEDRSGAGAGLGGRSGAGGAAQKSDDDGPEPPRFRLTSAEPKTYILRLPPNLGAMTNLALTVAVGKRHLVVATAPDLARAALALEGATEGLWAPAGELAETLGRLPETLTMLRVSDPNDTLPEALAALPATLETLTSTIATARQAAETARAEAEGGPARTASGGPPPGAPGPGYPGAASRYPGGPGPGYPGGPGPGYPGGPGPAGSSAGMSRGGYSSPTPPPTQGGSQAQGEQAPRVIRLNPARAPKPEEVRDLLFPGTLAVSVDDQGLQVVTRSAFPNIVSSSGGISTALLLPAIQAARDAARRAAEQVGGAGRLGAGDAGLPALGDGPDLEEGRGWNPDPALRDQLQPPARLPGGLTIRVPQGFTPLRVEPPEFPIVGDDGDPPQVLAWHGPARPDGTAPRIDVIVQAAPADRGGGEQPGPDDELDAQMRVMPFISASGGGLRDFQTTATTERGRAGDAPALRDLWTGTGADGVTRLHGFTYLIESGNVLVGISGVDSANHQDAFRLMEAAALTIGK